MAKVKGTKSSRLQVVPYRPYHRTLQVSAVAVGLFVVGAMSFGIGHYWATSSQADAVTELSQLRSDLASRTQEVDTLSQKTANLQLANEVDQVSNEGVRQEVIVLKEEIAKLEEDITFYRGLMAPTDNERGLTIGAVDVISTGVDRQYDFKVVVQQLAANHQVLTGTLIVNIVGSDGGIPKTIPLQELSSQVESDGIKLKFKYFQNIAGQLELPFGFEPERIEVMARTTGKDAAEVEKKFGWLVQES